jgi:hypothetical protein
MAQDRPGADPDRLVVAALDAVALRHAHWREPTEAETAAAVAELREILAGRDDGAALLAETAGLLAGFHEGDLNEPKARTAAHFCIAAGADRDQVARWEEEGQRRRANASLPPFSGGVR